MATVSVNEIEFNIRVLSFNRRVNLYSIDTQLNVHGENEVCLIFLMGADSDIAVASNVVRSALNAVFAMCIRINQPSRQYTLKLYNMSNEYYVLANNLLLNFVLCIYIA